MKTAMNDLARAKTHLTEEGCTCVVCRGEMLVSSRQRGVAPLVSWYESKTDLLGASAADKVVGKATAFLYLLHGVSAVYAGVISRPALALLQGCGVAVEYGEAVEHIVNRRGDGICPFEEAVLDETDAMSAYRRIRRKMTELQIPLV